MNNPFETEQQIWFPVRILKQIFFINILEYALQGSRGKSGKSPFFIEECWWCICETFYVNYCHTEPFILLDNFNWSFFSKLFWMGYCNFSPGPFIYYTDKYVYTLLSYKTIKDGFLYVHFKRNKHDFFIHKPELSLCLLEANWKIFLWVSKDIRW